MWQCPEPGSGFEAPLQTLKGEVGYPTKASYPFFCKQSLISVLYTILKPCGAWGAAVVHWPPRSRRTSMGTLFPNWLLRIECSILQGRQPWNLSPIPSHCGRETGFLQQVSWAIGTKQNHPRPPGRHSQLRSYFLKDGVWKLGNQARILYSARTKRKGRLSLLWPSVSPVVRQGLDQMFSDLLHSQILHSLQSLGLSGWSEDEWTHSLPTIRALGN